MALSRTLIIVFTNTCDPDVWDNGADFYLETTEFYCMGHFGIYFREARAHSNMTGALT